MAADDPGAARMKRAYTNRVKGHRDALEQAVRNCLGDYAVAERLPVGDVQLVLSVTLDDIDIQHSKTAAVVTVQLSTDTDCPWLRRYADPRGAMALYGNRPK